MGPRNGGPIQLQPRKAGAEPKEGMQEIYGTVFQENLNGPSPMCYPFRTNLGRMRKCLTRTKGNVFAAPLK